MYIVAFQDSTAKNYIFRRFDFVIVLGLPLRESLLYNTHNAADGVRGPGMPSVRVSSRAF